MIIPPKYNDKASNQNLTILFDGLKLCFLSLKQLNILDLGLQIDDDLTFKTHINFVHSRLSRTLGTMFKVKHNLPKNDLLLLHNTLFHPHLSCCISAWFSAFSTLLNPLHTHQNKAIKFIEGLSHWQSSRLLQHKIKLYILKINDLIGFELGKFVHRHLNNKL